MRIHFGIKGLEFIHFNSILRENGIKNYLPESLQKGEISSTGYSLSNNISNKYINHKPTKIT